MASDINSLPIDSWLNDMKAAIDQISDLGRSILDTHRSAGDKAEKNAGGWHLAERLEQERLALLGFVESVRRIIESAEQCRQLLHTVDAAPGDVQQAIDRCAEVIEGNRHDDVIKVIRTRKGRYE